MARHSYKLALRAKGIRRLPPHSKLRSYRGAGPEQHVIEPIGRKAKCGPSSI